MPVDWDRASTLVVRAQRGDTLAMSDLLDITAPYVTGICMRITPHHGEDAAQNALTVVFRRLGTLTEPPALRGWLRTVATREAIRLGSEPRHEPLDEATTPARDDHAPELTAFLGAELARLPATQRAVFVLREVEGLSEREIADVLRIAPGTVKSRLSRAKDGIRRAWTS